MRRAKINTGGGVEKKKRGNLDFKDHELIIQENDLVKIHHLKRPNSYIDSIKFINCGGVLSVTGGYGNWIFCREFHPSSDGRVSGGSWLEKLKIASSQDGTEFDSKETRKAIEEGLNGGLVKHGYTGDELQDVREYYQELLDYYVDCGEWEYAAYAYNDRPDFMDAESVPFERKTKYWLKVVFDGFEEVCRRLKD